MKVNYHTVGERIRNYRLDKGITQEELAFRVNTSSAYISNIENAKKRPSLNKLIEISEVLGVTVNDLIYPHTENGSFTESSELSRMIALFPSDKQKVILSHMSAIIKSFITQ